MDFLLDFFDVAFSGQTRLANILAQLKSRQQRRRQKPTKSILPEK